MDIFSNPIFFGLIASIITYYVLKSDKDDEKKKMSFKYAILVGLLVWLTGYYFQRNDISQMSQIMPNVNYNKFDILTDKPNWK